MLIRNTLASWRWYNVLGEEQKRNILGSVAWDLILRTQCSHVILYYGYPTLYLALCHMF